MNKPGKFAKTIPLLIASGMLILALLVGVVAVRLSSPYRRYVSPPLPGGARYTFLYPAHLRGIHPANASYLGPAGAVQAVRFNTVRNPSDTPSIMERLPDWLESTFNRSTGQYGPNEEIFVFVSRSKPDNDSRTEERERVGDTETQFLEIMDTNIGWGIKILYQRQTGSPAFDRTATVIAKSVRVLRPGEEPPVGEKPDEK